jgi:hypothetical protein
MLRKFPFPIIATKSFGKHLKLKTNITLCIKFELIERKKNDICIKQWDKINIKKNSGTRFMKLSRYHQYYLALRSIEKKFDINMTLIPQT